MPTPKNACDLFNPPEGTLTNPFQIREPRHREVNKCAADHITSQQRSSRASTLTTRAACLSLPTDWALRSNSE